MDTELLGKIRIVKNYHHNLPVVLNKIKSKCVRDVRMAGKLKKAFHIFIRRYNIHNMVCLLEGGDNPRV